MSSHQDDDIVELDEMDIEAIEDEFESKTQVSGLSHEDIVFEPTSSGERGAGAMDPDAMDPDATVDRDPDATSLTGGGGHAPVGGAGVRPSGEHQAIRPSGSHQAVRPSGAHAAVRPSGSHRAANQSGQFPSASPSGQHRAANQSGQFPSASQSGQHRAANQSGQFPSASQSGQHRAANQSGQFPSASQSGQHRAANQSGQFPSARQSGAHASLRESGIQPVVGAAQDASQRTNSGQFHAAPKLSNEQNFYNIPTGHTGRLPQVNGPEEETLKTPRALFLRGLAFCLPVALTALGAVAYFTVTRWLSPAQAMLWAGLGVTFPTFFVALLTTWPPEGTKATAKHWAAGLAPGLVFGLVGLLVSFAWSNTDVREQAFAYVPDEPRLLTKIFQEKDLTLAVASCKRMVKRIESPEWRVAVLRNMTLRPAATAQCLRSLPETPDRGKIVATVSARWQKELLASSDVADAERMCQIAASMTELTISPKTINANLLTCTLTAADESSQDCCGKILVQKLSSHDEVVEQLRGSLDLMAGREATGSLMSMAFHKHNLTKPQEQLAKKLGFTSTAGQHATLELACLTLREQNESSIVPHMTASLEGVCAVDHTALSQANEDWVAVCDTALALLEEDADLEPPRALCDATERQFVAVAAGKASNFVHHAIRSNQRSNLGSSIEVGFATERAQEMSPEDWARKASLQQKLIRDGMSPERAAARAGLDYSKMSNVSPSYQGAPQATTESVESIMGKLGSAEAQQVLSADNIGDFQKAARGAGMKFEKGEGPAPPPGAEDR